MKLTEAVQAVIDKGSFYRRALFPTILTASALMASTPAASSASFCSLSSYTIDGIVAEGYSRNPSQSYDLNRDGMYVHVPSFVEVKLVPRSVFGHGLYGLAIPSTGQVFVRDDLEGDAFYEVLDHEIGHVIDSSLGENKNRSIMRTKWGARGLIHQKLGGVDH